MGGNCQGSVRACEELVHGGEVHRPDRGRASIMLLLIKNKQESKAPRRSHLRARREDSDARGQGLWNRSQDLQGGRASPRAPGRGN